MGVRLLENLTGHRQLQDLVSLRLLESGDPFPLAIPATAPARLRAASSAYTLLLSATPRDGGLTSVLPQITDRGLTWAARLANYATLVSAPRDGGLTPVPRQWPDRAWAAPWSAPIAYAITLPTPIDAGLMSSPPQILDRASASLARLANYATFVRSPVDAGLEPVPWQWPDRAPAAQRTAWTAYAPLAATPVDIGLTPPLWQSPDRASAPLARLANYATFVRSPVDAGLTPIPVLTRDGGWGRPTAYSLVTPMPGDQGIAILPPPIVSSAPDRAWATFRIAAIAPFAVPTPRDGGLTSIPALVRDGGWGRPTVYSLFVPMPGDQGIVITPVSLPANAPDRTWRTFCIAAIAPFATRSPVDAGLVPVPTQVPDRAPTAQRTAWTAYAITVPTPGDMGIMPVLWQWPDRAPTWPSRLANYAAVVPTPVDAGLTPIPQSIPDLSPAWAIRLTNYALIVSPSVDSPNLVPPAIAPSYPPMAPGTQRSAPTSYVSLVSATPPDSGIVPMYLPYEVTSTVIAVGNVNPFDIDPEQTTLITSGNVNPFDIDPEQTTVITKGLTSSD